MRLVPGTGEWKINGRTLEEYFPNALTSRTCSSPFTLLDIAGRFDVVARSTAAASPGRPVRCAWASPARSTRSTATRTVRR